MIVFIDMGVYALFKSDNHRKPVNNLKLPDSNMFPVI